MASESSSGNRRWYGHFLIPIFGIALAISLWLWWLCYGMIFAHHQVLRQVTSTVTLTSAPAASAPIAAVPQLDRERYFTELGQTGDSFGGLNALLTAIAGVLVLWAGVMQHLALKQAQARAQEERNARLLQETDSKASLELAKQTLQHELEATAKERDSRRLQEFEALFFRLLELSSAVTNRIETDAAPSISVTVPGEGTRSSSSPVRRGPAALASFASSLRTRAIRVLPPLQQNPNAQLEKLVGLFLTQVYDRRPSAFGPYFRILYQTFRHISDSHLPYEAQIKYANIARGQISEGAVLLLALNGLTVDGYKFAPLIEKFGLLEHLHRRYAVEFKALLQIGYRNRAFMGSEERAKPENEFIDTPKLGPNHFLELEKDRKVAEEESDFEAGYSGLDNGDL